ncbi:MAG: hypothetical protein JXP34_20040 [Planctomycetes bacterium]|nr:hypothetical protein [Planctomycetota bacterium]
MTLAIAIVLLAAPADVPYGIGMWPEELGNHRARIRVASRAAAVRARILWRRPDADPEKKDIIVVDAATGKAIEDRIRVAVSRASGEIIFRPNEPGEYFVYYLPNRIAGSRSFPDAVYTAPRDTADPAWVRRVAGMRGIPDAEVLEIQARGAANRFDPMEVIATPEETEALIAAHPGRPFLLFPEDRAFPIRRRDDLPLRWIRSGSSDTFRGRAARGEFYAFQIGVFGARRAIEDLEVSCDDPSLRCFPLGGTDARGAPFRNRISIPRGKVQALWLGLPIPKDAAPGGAREFSVTVRDGGESATVRASIEIADEIREDAGDGEPWRHSRLRWIDSTLGIDDGVTKPYMPLVAGGDAIACLGRRVHFGPTGIPSRITSLFAWTGDAIEDPGREILARPMAFVVESADGPLAWTSDPARVIEETPGHVIREAASRAGPLVLRSTARMDYDGYIDIQLELKAERDVDLRDARLEVPLRRDVARYLMGMGRKGGLRPAAWSWTWDARKHQDSIWIGDVNAGLQLKLKGRGYAWPLVNIHYHHGPLRLPEAWYNDGRGGVTVVEAGEDEVLVRAYGGARILKAGGSLRFDVGLLVTPVKPIDAAGRWGTRYFHAVAPPEKILEAGANVAIIHHGNDLNPYINYPFLAADKLAAYVRDAHAKGLRVKIYYTLRELSSHIAELWAVRSLPDPVFADGPGGGCAWLKEHLGGGYIRAWHHSLPDGDVDAALVTAGSTRWQNYHVEGLAWLAREVGIDGLYLDDVGFDRRVMQRVRKVLDSLCPGGLIDLHSWNHFNEIAGFASCANLYLEHMPYLDSLWLGEGFNYDETPDYWLVEISGIPFGLMGEMLQGGGNPWRGMVYGMTARLPWAGDPRPIWKVADAFGIGRARMIGYWAPDVPVRSDRDDVRVTIYEREDRMLIALASWAKEPVRCRLVPAVGPLVAPAIAGFQPAARFEATDEIPVDPGRGWLLIAPR